MAYVKVGPWVNGGVPPIDKDNLDHLETQYDESTTDLTAHKTNAVAPGVHRWTANKLLLGAGAAANPTEVDWVNGLIVRKTADEIVNNSIVLQNDDELLFAMGANEVWEVTLLLINYSPSAVPLMSLGTSLPVGATLHGVVLYQNAAGTDQVNTGIIEGAIGTIYAVNSIRCRFSLKAVVINGANAGNFQLQWAQGVATVENTTMKANSCLIAHKLA